MATITKRASDVRISELDLSTTLSGVSLCTAAQVVVSSQGPLVPTFYTNADDFRFDFGNPDAKVSFDGYSAVDFFSLGNSMWAVRAVNQGVKDYSYAHAILTDAAGVTTWQSPSVDCQDTRNFDWTTVTTGNSGLYVFSARNGPGSYGNKIAVEIVSENITFPNNITIASNTLGGFLAASTYEYVVSAIGQSGETLASAPISIVVSGVSTTNTVTLKWNAVTGSIGYKIYGRISGSAYYLTTVGGSTLQFTDTGALTPDSTQLPITIAANLPPPSTNFKVKVYDLRVSASNAVEEFNCSTVPQLDSTGLQMETSARINPYSRYIRVDSNLNNLASIPAIYSIGKQVLSRGSSGSAPTAADLVNAWNLFTNKEKFQLDVLINAGHTSLAVQKGMDALAQLRSDCIAFLDMPSSSQTAQTAADYANLTLGLNSSYSAIFCQDILETDPVQGNLLFVPPSGMVAGLLARTYNNFSPWKAIAGLNRGNLTGRAMDLRYAFDDAQSTLLYLNRVNYFRKFARAGMALWECNTLLSANSALQFANIRVLCNTIKRAAYNFLLYALQEPNTDRLRKQIVFGISDYMRTVQSGEGVKQFQVTADSTNNNATLSNAGILAVALVIWPTIAVREIQLTLGIAREGLSIDEKTIGSF